MLHQKKKVLYIPKKKLKMKNYILDYVLNKILICLHYRYVQTHIRFENSSAISAMKCFAKRIICCCTFDVYAIIILMHTLNS